MHQAQMRPGSRAQHANMHRYPAGLSVIAQHCRLQFMTETILDTLKSAQHLRRQYESSAVLLELHKVTQPTFPSRRAPLGLSSLSATASSAAEISTSALPLAMVHASAMGGLDTLHCWVAASAEHRQDSRHKPQTASLTILSSVTVLMVHGSAVVANQLVDYNLELQPTHLHADRMLQHPFPPPGNQQTSTLKPHWAQYCCSSIWSLLTPTGCRSSSQHMQHDSLPGLLSPAMTHWVNVRLWHGRA